MLNANYRRCSILCFPNLRSPTPLATRLVCQGRRKTFRGGAATSKSMRLAVKWFGFCTDTYTRMHRTPGDIPQENLMHSDGFWGLLLSLKTLLWSLRFSLGIITKFAPRSHARTEIHSRNRAKKRRTKASQYFVGSRRNVGNKFHNSCF